MYEAIVTLVIKANGLRTIHEPAHTEVYRLEFDSESAVRNFLDVGSYGPAGLVSFERLTVDRPLEVRTDDQGFDQLARDE